jgi:zinc finger protein
LTIPEIDLVLTHGTLGGRFTTVEGILEQIYEELGEKAFVTGDSADTDERSKLEEFLARLKQVHCLSLIAKLSC